MSYSYEENRNHCKHIAEELLVYYNGLVWKCPECGEIFTHEDEPEKCPSCEHEFESDFENLTLWDWYAETDFYDEEFHISRDGSLRGVTLMVACGGPNIYINTKTCRVELYWWSDYADYPIDRDICEEIDNIVSEYVSFSGGF